MRARRAGARTLPLDRVDLPRDKACGVAIAAEVFECSPAVVDAGLRGTGAISARSTTSCGWASQTVCSPRAWPRP